MNRDRDCKESKAPSDAVAADGRFKVLDIGARPESTTQSIKRLQGALGWIRAREGRSAAFEADIFADPAWDILLDLYVTFRRNQQISISDLYATCAVPPTTILRWIGTLERHELIQRRTDPNDRRRRYVVLTPLGVEKMELTLDRAMEGHERLGLGRLALIEPQGHG